MQEHLLVDVGSTFTKACLVDAGARRVLGWGRAPTTVGTDVNAGLAAALQEMGQAGRDVSGALVCSSAAGGLRIAAVGLVPDLTLEAARMAALGAGGKVVAAYSYRLTDSDLARLVALAPDLVLLAGGTDGGDAEHILRNAELLNACLPKTPLVVAGNREAEDALRGVFAGRGDVRFAANVMPEIGRLDLPPAREAIRSVFLERIVRAKGLDRLAEKAAALMPTPQAALAGAELLSQGLPGKPGLGELLAVDVGGATTDVVSCASGAPESPGTVVRGLPELFVKRTVEGDIGMRRTLASLLEEAGAGRVAEMAGVAEEAVREWAGAVAADPGRLPADEGERRIERACARAAVEIAVARHCGTLEEAYTPQGRMFVQRGKDLGAVKCVLGTGGPIAASQDPAGILQGAVRRPGQVALAPRNPALLVDRRYILWAMGLLAQAEPDVALEMMMDFMDNMDRMDNTGSTDAPERRPCP